MGNEQQLWIIVGFCLICSVFSVTDPNDARILNGFRKGVENPELLKWPANGDDPCGPPHWPHVFCNGNRVTQIQIQGLGLKGKLPQDFNGLAKLRNLGLQRNHFYGKLPSFSGLSELEYAYLNSNDFDLIPLDFFDGLTSIRVLALDHNPLNATAGWPLPSTLGQSNQLVNLSLVGCNLVGPLPDFLGTLRSLSTLLLSYNRLSGAIPMSFNESMLRILWLNDQKDAGMTGPIDVIPSMALLSELWLHGNSFTGTIPEGIGSLKALKDLNLNRNKLVGLIPLSLANMDLDELDLNNNMLMGPIPKFKSRKVSYNFNSFCQAMPGNQCAPEVNTLIDFLRGLNYPLDLASDWSGNDPCHGLWRGVSCNDAAKVTVLNLPNRKLEGMLSASIANLDSLLEIRLGGNNLSGKIPTDLTQLKLLRLLDINGNNFSPPLPQFRPDVKVLIDGNPLSPSSGKSPPFAPLNQQHTILTGSKRSRITIIAIVASVVILVLLAILLCIYCCKKPKQKQKQSLEAPSSEALHTRDPSHPQNTTQTAVPRKSAGGLFSESSSGSRTTSGFGNSTERGGSGNLTIPVQVLRKVTNNFAPENKLGQGGFGSVYKGELEDGTCIAVKRMQPGMISSKVLDEFQAEIDALSMVRHRHLVSLYGYSTEDNERLLFYEYMPKGALSRHLFHWKNFGLEPLSWKKRLSIALDVARGMQYLHSLANQIFIHRDLKPSNILLDDEYRAKVSDFGLVKLADRDKSLATRIAGTFGYLAPEYAATGKVTTKVDVFSYGVVLIELLTGLMALDENRPEESQVLAEWFWRIKSCGDRLMAAIDPTINVQEDASGSISAIAELAGHCTTRDPSHRPDMGYAVGVLAPFVERWKPFDEDDAKDHSCTVMKQLFSEMNKGRFSEGEQDEDVICTSLDCSFEMIPARPTIY